MTLRFDRAEAADMTVLGEGARLERVFENLVDNAVSFSPEGGTVTIAAREEAGWLVVSVEMTGPAFPRKRAPASSAGSTRVRPDSGRFRQAFRAWPCHCADHRRGASGHDDGRIARGSRARRPFVVRLPLAEQS